MTASATVDQLVENFLQQRPIRAGSLIITLYGDAIVPRGGTVWLGSLFKLLAPFGINERLVRTSVYRLTNESWLEGDKVGRRSYYRLSGAGRRRFDQAFKRVYHGLQDDWSGHWTLVLLAPLETTERQRLREELEWLGFGAFGPGVLAHPGMLPAEVNAALNEIEITESPVIMRTEPMDPVAPRAIRRQVHESWNLNELADHYSDFLERFRPLWQAMSQRDDLSDQQAFMARTLLIHEYRKVQLRDPQLPEALLPTAWEGRNALQLTRNLYRAIHRRAERWLDLHLETAEGPLPAPGPAFYHRFGGLHRPEEEFEQA
ncbi:phenylacetic acid degradation operon negative regulatory protein PaaX [Halomonas sp.]|uniref:phenylacetic acid degradation operon negative regulatory protein PaaX n=1 Tax=Halomonas sp. TaxID=1486246 RepID=UPI00257FA31A|nr:phenylacetic acid degradation operon negative regulatory protein PaaX [Halomonas sp.]MCJ8287223.1 phenylacetic acid degradation operon negative regulatory protein PaaX [Halomonas sp.]NQY71938.1 phenylacetic acid degradation operon negative regulatory protein PaaX [Halomonas sp.]